MSLNLDSPEMPKFLQMSHGEVFEFVQKPRQSTHRRHMTELRDHLDIYEQSPSSIRETPLSLPRLNNKLQLKSFGH